MKIPLTRPWADDSEWKAVREVLESGWWTQGEKVAEFEAAVRNYIGADSVVACSNCTTALHVAMLLMEVGPGDEVIVPSYTWITTPNVVRMVGAVPVFADIDLLTYNLDPHDVERRITSRTKGVIPVHQFGLPADLEVLSSIARRHKLWIVEDAACALGSRYKGKPIGSHSDIVCFSFHPRKVISTGEGGIIAFNKPDMASRARSLVSHGASLSDRAKDAASELSALKQEEFHALGYNYRLSDIQAAVGVEQMKKLNELLRLRAQGAQRYQRLLSDIPEIVMPFVPTEVTFNWQSFVIRFTDDCGASMEKVAQHLLKKGVSCRAGYMACHVQAVYRTLYPGIVLPNTENALIQALMLPLYPQMTEEEQDYVVEQISQVLRVRS